jgi:hypothetical protein
MNFWVAQRQVIIRSTAEFSRSVRFSTRERDRYGSLHGLCRYNTSRQLYDRMELRNDPDWLRFRKIYIPVGALGRAGTHFASPKFCRNRRKMKESPVLTLFEKSSISSTKRIWLYINCLEPLKTKVETASRNNLEAGLNLPQTQSTSENIFT